MTDRHISHYLILVLGLVVAMILFVYFKFNPLAQTVVSGIGSLYYIAWGIVHHSVEGRLSKMVVLEYVLFGVLIFVLVLASLYLL